MQKETSAGAVVFRKENDQILYLILQYTKKHWDFPKGHVEPGETEHQTVKRETEEETGIKDLTILNNFKESINYTFAENKKLINKDVHFYLAETKTKEIKLSFEHIGYKWLTFDEALEQLTFDNAKNIITKANSILSAL